MLLCAQYQLRQPLSSFLRQSYVIPFALLLEEIRRKERRQAAQPAEEVKASDSLIPINIYVGMYLRAE